MPGHLRAVLGAARRSGTGQKTSTTNERRHQGASLAAIMFLTAYGGSDTGAAPADSHTRAIYGSGCTKLLFSSSAGGPTPRQGR